MKNKIRKVGVLMGGTSAEREVSLKSGAAVCRAIGELGIDYAAIDVDRTVCSKILSEGIDFAFIALHGGWGENGGIQGMLEIMGIPYSGSGVLASAVAMDKEITKKIFAGEGIPIAPFFIIRDTTDRNDLQEEYYQSRGFQLPLFVKPSTEGSSVGVTMVKEAAQFRQAVTGAFAYGARVIVEKYIRGKEIQIGILGDRALGGVEVRPSDEFYSFRAKYTPGATQYILPPELEPEAYEKARETALRAHRALECSGATRVDLIVDPEGGMYVLEVNTIPGMTETSLLPKIAALAGYDFRGLIREIILDGLKGKGVI